MPAELILESLGFSYDLGLPTERAVLESLSLRVRTGELVSVVGRTGSGKTTLGLIMAGLLKPQTGEVRLDGTRTVEAQSPDGRIDVVMVFQVPESQFFEEDVYSEVAFGPLRLGLRGAELKDRVFRSLSRLGLDPVSVAGRSPAWLSEGEKRKVAVACALSCDPRFLILDEPTISLDWQATAGLFALLRTLSASGVCVVVMTHEVEHAAAHSDRIAVLSGGRLRASGRLSAEEVYSFWRDGR